MAYNHSTRIRFLSIFFIVFGLLLITKLFFVQILHNDAYSDRADHQYATPASNIFERGSIFFSDKNGNLVSGATVISGFKIAINPQKIDDEEFTYKQISSIIPTLEKEPFLLKANNKDDYYEEILHKITKEKADRIRALTLNGVDVFKEKWRFYPGNNLAAHILGFLGYEGNKIAGRYGLERYYDDSLSRSKDNLYVNFFAEVFSNINNSVRKLRSKDSNYQEGDIITTIEPIVQGFLEEQLQSIITNWDADLVSGIIINPKDGSIYSMASLPNFNLNDFSEVKNPLLFSNPSVENVFELGSIIKPLVMVAGLDVGVVEPDTTYYDGGSVVVENKIIHNFDKKGRGTISMQEVINQSLNTGMVFVQQLLGKENMRKYMFSYGIGEKTGIDLPNETSGLISNLNSKRDIEYATASFGQGVALTPIGAVRAFSVLANGGKFITPHLIREIKLENGGTKEINYPISEEQIIKLESSQKITSMLVKFVDDVLLSGKAKIKNYTIAAKTGTAQIAKEDGIGYYEDRFLHSFVGYFPAYDPKFLILLYIINPKEVRFASQTLAPVFMDITKFLLNYYDIPPDR